MGTKRRSSPRPLTELDELIMRAARWAWWTQYHNYVVAGNTHYLSNITVTKDELYRLLHHTFKGVPSDQRPEIPGYDQINYRLRKLATRGLLQGRGYGGYRLKEADGYVNKLIEDAQRKEKERQQQIRDEIDTLSRKLEYLVPDGNMKVENNMYHQRTNPDAIVLTITGSAHHLQFLFLLAEREQRRQDEKWKKAMDDLTFDSE